MKRKLLGTITDGDIRRGILNGLNSSNSIKGVFNLNPVKVNQKLFTEKKALNIIKKYNIELVPIVNNDNVVKNIFYKPFKKNKDNKKLNNISVVIMAGGKGSRMAPFTKVLPNHWCQYMKSL